jgi:hypothetical protein
MHIMSSHCTPLPLIWGQAGGIQLSTKWLDRGGVALRPILGKIGIVGKKETTQICDLAEAQNREAYKDLDGYPQQPDKLFSIMLGMPMDMEYAHYAGFEGHKIYYQVKQWSYIQVLTTSAGASSAPTTHAYQILLAPKPEDIIGDNPLSQQLAKEFADLRKEQEKELQADYNQFLSSRSSYQQTVTGKRFFVVLNYQDATDKKIKRKIAWLNEEENEAFIPWHKQIKHIILSELKHPWRHIPFFHYDPRRWEGKKQPFREQIATKKSKGIFLGVKMYRNYSA